MFSIEITGLKKVISKMSKMPDAVNESVEDSISVVADMAKEFARENCPVGDTGNLRDSIFVVKHKDRFELGATMPYTVFNEYGCYNIRVGSVEHPIPGRYSGMRPFLRPAMIRASRAFPEIFGKKWYEIISHG